MKKPRPTVVEKIQAQQAAAVPQVRFDDIHNVLQALRHGGLGTLSGAEIAAVGASMGRLEAAIAPFLKQQQATTSQPSLPLESTKA